MIYGHAHTHTYLVPERIYIQLPNVSAPMDIRVREGVNTTLDCGLRIDSLMLKPNVRTYWSLRKRKVDGTITSPVKVTNAE